MFAYIYLYFHSLYLASTMSAVITAGIQDCCMAICLTADSALWLPESSNPTFWLVESWNPVLIMLASKLSWLHGIDCCLDIVKVLSWWFYDILILSRWRSYVTLSWSCTSDPWTLWRNWDNKAVTRQQHHRSCSFCWGTLCYRTQVKTWFYYMCCLVRCYFFSIINRY